MGGGASRKCAQSWCQRRRLDWSTGELFLHRQRFSEYSWPLNNTEVRGTNPTPSWISMYNWFSIFIAPLYPRSHPMADCAGLHNLYFFFFKFFFWTVVFLLKKFCVVFTTEKKNSVNKWTYTFQACIVQRSKCIYRMNSLLKI